MFGIKSFDIHLAFDIWNLDLKRSLLFWAMTLFLHPFISFDDILNEGMSDNILVREVNEFDPFDSFENALDFD